MWEKIRSQKELNLPDQRVLVAILRCNELKEEAFKHVYHQLDDLKSRCESHRVENFSDSCLIIIREALFTYDEEAKHYDKAVYEKQRAELLFSLLLQ